MMLSSPSYLRDAVAHVVDLLLALVGSEHHAARVHYQVFHFLLLIGHHMVLNVNTWKKFKKLHKLRIDSDS